MHEAVDAQVAGAAQAERATDPSAPVIDQCHPAGARNPQAQTLLAQPRAADQIQAAGGQQVGVVGHCWRRGAAIGTHTQPDAVGGADVQAGVALADHLSLRTAIGGEQFGARVDRAHKKCRARRQGDVGLHALGQQQGAGVDAQVIGCQVQSVDHLNARALLAGGTGTDRAAEVGRCRLDPQGGGGQQVVVELGQATGLDANVFGCMQVATQQGIALGNHLHLVAGQRTIGQCVVVVAGDRAVECDVKALERERAGRLDAAAAAVEVEQTQLGLDAQRHAALLGDDCAIDQHVVGADQTQAAAGIGGHDAGRVLDHQAVKAWQDVLLLGRGVGDGQRAAADALAVATAQFHPVGRLDGAQHRQGAGRTQQHVAAGAAGDHAALDHALAAGGKTDGAIDGFQHAGVVQIDQAAVEVDGAVGPQLASDVLQAVVAALNTDVDHRAGARCVDRKAADRAVGGGSCRKAQAQIGAAAGVAGAGVHGRGQHLELVRADQAQLAFAELDGHIGLALREVGHGGQSGVDRAECRQVTALALGDAPLCAQQLGVEGRLQLGDGGVAGGAGGRDVDDGLDFVADLVDLGDHSHVVAQHAVGRHRPVGQHQFVQIGRRQDVDAIRGADGNHAVVAQGIEADRAQQYEAAAVVGCGLAWGAGVIAALQIDFPAGRQVGADDQLAVGADPDFRIHVVVCQLAAHVLALSSDDLAAPAGQQ